MKVSQLMTEEVMVCTEADTLNRAAQLMWEFDCGCIPVVNVNGNGRLVGVVTDRDIAMAAYTQGKPLWGIPVTTAMARKAITCQADNSIEEAEALMRENRVHRLPVVDDNARVIGIISLNDVVREAQREASGGRRREVTGEGVLLTLAALCEPRSRELALAS